jgi:hypothetical protein
MDEQPVKANLATVFRDPKASLQDVYRPDDRIELYNPDGTVQPLRVSKVRNRSLVGRFIVSGGREMTATRLILERDAQGNVIGLKEPGRTGRRVV